MVMGTGFAGGRVVEVVLDPRVVEDRTVVVVVEAVEGAAPRWLFRVTRPMTRAATRHAARRTAASRRGRAASAAGPRPGGGGGRWAIVVTIGQHPHGAGHLRLLAA
jgi:hypothetical protein